MPSSTPSPLFEHGHPQGFRLAHSLFSFLTWRVAQGVGVVVWFLRFLQLSLKKWVKKFKDALYIPNSDLHKFLLMRHLVINHVPIIYLGLFCFIELISIIDIYKENEYPALFTC